MAVPPSRSPAASRTLAQLLSGLVGIAFAAAGVLGFVPGVTTDAADIDWAGHDSPAQLFGVFQVSVLHNAVHLGFGLVGLLAAARYATARTYLFVGGFAYLGLWVYGAVVDKASDANFVPLNDADDWLHLGLGLGMVLAGFLAGTTSFGGRNAAEPMDPTRATSR